jgi:two-component system, NtrC family, nitrogen regulation response regulator GlnG
VVARAVHKFSPRTAREFVAINCAAIPENLLESELFGHEKGAFTGASTQRIGRFEQCDGGTLFLDEIGDMPMQLQSKILRVLQEGEFSRVGGNQTLRTDVRVLAATNKNLEKEVEQNRFREDLFYRLNVVRLHLPPLRERPDDIRPLANFFLQRLIAKKKGNQRLRFAETTLDVLSNYNWPGNVRELENTILRAVALANTEVLMPKDIPLGSNLDELPNPEAILAAGPTLTLAEIWAFAKANDPANPLQWLTTALKSHDRN